MFHYGLQPGTSGYANQELLTFTETLLLIFGTSSVTVHNQHMLPHWS